ncbi:hypothetical protein [Streptomyces incanus]
MDFDTFTVGLQVRADDGHETYLAVSITGSVPPNLTTLILSNLPAARPTAGIPDTPCRNGTSSPPNKPGPT